MDTCKKRETHGHYRFHGKGENSSKKLWDYNRVHNLGMCVREKILSHRRGAVVRKSYDMSMT